MLTKRGLMPGRRSEKGRGPLRTASEKSITYVEAFISAGCCFLHGSLLDITGHVAGNRGQERLYLFRRSLGYEFHVPAWQVAHVTRDREVFCQMLGCVPEADALNPAGISNLFTNHHCFIVASRRPSVHCWFAVRWSNFVFSAVLRTAAKHEVIVDHATMIGTAPPFTLLRGTRFTAIIRMSTPTQLVPKGLVVAAAGHLYQAEIHRSAADNNSVLHGDGKRLLAIRTQNGIC
jgi:hypothetical protein